MGISRRTVQRLVAGKSHASQLQVARLTRAVHPKNRELATRLAVHAEKTLVELGLEAPASNAPAPSPRAATSIAPSNFDHLVDSLVCAAADASAIHPSALRPALLAAFTRARELTLDVATVEGSLRKSAKRRPAAS